MCVARGQLTYRSGSGHTGMHCSSAGGAAAAEGLAAASGDSAGWWLVRTGECANLRQSANHRAGQELH